MKTAEKVAYHTYLQLPELLNLQFPLAEPTHHDELLFIIVHQCHELWFKQIIHELKKLGEKFDHNELFESLKTLRRVQEIFKLLAHHMGILNTLSPDEFAGYRDILAPASGFQSYQFRMVEFLCGAKDKGFIEGFSNSKEAYLSLKEMFDSPSLNDRILTLLKQRDLLPNAVTHDSKDDILQAVLTVYKKRNQYSDLHLLFENLVDLDQLMQTWRTQHVKIAERMIGDKMGTGGSSGVDYLSRVTSKKLFPILWEVRTLI